MRYLLVQRRHYIFCSRYAAGDTTGAPENDTSRMEHAEDGNHVYTSLDQSAAANDKETRPANSHVNPTYNVSIDEP